jgi:cysteine desulfurase
MPIYLDYNATTPLDPRVFKAMQAWFLGPPANAGSRTHIYGQRAKDAVEKARQQVADVLDAQPEEIIFTSGATESNNLAILGLAEHGEQTGRKHVISTAIEHKAVLEPLERMRRLGFEVDFTPVTAGGYVDVGAIKDRLRPDTLLVSVMHANNETGVLQPLSEIAGLLDGTDTLLHTDAAQTFGKDVEQLRRTPCDFISVSSHKIYGPQGVGVLYVRRRRASRRPLHPVMFGGGQERSLRPGTVPVPLIIGLGATAELAVNEHQARASAASRIKEEMLLRLDSVDHHINGDLNRSQPHVLNVGFPGVDSEALMMALRDEVAISNGSACTSASYDTSHVLLAMGFNEDRINSSVRISWGPGVDDIPVDPILSAVRRLRAEAW